MWSAKEKDESIDVRRLMGRVLNRSFTSGLLMEEHEERLESRSNVCMPVIVVAADDPDGKPRITTGITQDASCEGLAIYSHGHIPLGDVIVGFGPCDDNWSVLKCTCLRTKSVGYGYFLAGMHIDKVLPPSKYEPIKQYAAALGQMAKEELAAVTAAD